MYDHFLDFALSRISSPYVYMLAFFDSFKTYFSPGWLTTCLLKF